MSYFYSDSVFDARGLAVTNLKNIILELYYMVVGHFKTILYDLDINPWISQTFTKGHIHVTMNICLRSFTIYLMLFNIMGRLHQPYLTFSRD